MNRSYSAQKTISCVLKGVVFVSAVLGTVLSASAGRRSFMGGKAVFMYFTIQSNIALAILCAVGAVLLLRGGEIPRRWYVIKYVGTVSITLTGAVFAFVLAPTLGSAAWNLPNTLTHVVVPLASVADFFVTGVRSGIGKKNVFFVLLPPLAYAVYAGIGYALRWEFAPGVHYPYFFLNWGSPAGAFGFSRQLPFMGCAWWILALMALLLAVGYLYLAVLGLLKRRSGAEER